MTSIIISVHYIDRRIISHTTVYCKVFSAKHNLQINFNRKSPLSLLFNKKSGYYFFILCLFKTKRFAFFFLVFSERKIGAIRRVKTFLDIRKVIADDKTNRAVRHKRQLRVVRAEIFSPVRNAEYRDVLYFRKDYFLFLVRVADENSLR